MLLDKLSRTKVVVKILSFHSNACTLRTSLFELPSRISTLVDGFLEFDYQCGGHVAQVWPIMLGLCYPVMKDWSLKSQLHALIKRVFRNRQSGTSNLQFIEYFAGSAGLTFAMLSRQVAAVAFDIIFQPEHHDCLTSVGLRCWLDALAGTLEGAMTWFGTKCSSFVALSASQSGRTAENGFMGWEVPFVLEGNGLGEVSALVWFLSVLVGNVCGLEQPLSSVLPQTSSMGNILAFSGARKLVTYSGCFGAKTIKPLQLWFNTDHFSSLSREKPSWACDGLAVRGENGSYTGKSAEVADSEQYPELFCSEVAKLYCEHFLN